MNAGWFGRRIIGAVALVLLFCGTDQARATTITFEIITFGTSENVAVTVNTRQDIQPGDPVTTGGFIFTPGPINNPFNDLHISNQFSGDSSRPVDSFNGTTVGITHDDLIMTKEDGGTFSLQRFDFAGFPTDKEVPFLVTGDLGGSTLITQTFYPDGRADGNVEPEVADFQTFYLNSDWTNLVSVTWKHTGYGTDRGLFALDNIVVNEPKSIPEPSTITLLGLVILVLLGQGWCSRKQLKALGEMA